MSTLFHALKWSVAGELASRAIQPLVFVILARILTPNDYGVVAAAVMVISFTQVFWESGMSKALVQRQSDLSETATIGFWINLFLGVIISCILFFSATLIAEKIFNDLRVADVLKVMTLQIIFGAVASMPNAWLQKELQFNKLFWVRITTVALPGIFSIPLALYGWSYWSLVLGTLSGQLVQAVVLWNLHPWRPTFTFNTRLVRSLFRFSFWVSMSGLLAWFYIWMDSLFVGAYLGIHDLGLYRTGNQFVTLIFGLVFSPLLPVMYSHFSGLQHDPIKLKNTFLRSFRLVILISVPLGFFIFSISNTLVKGFFGETWTGISFVVSLLALTQGYSWVTGLNGELYRAIGKPYYETLIPLTLMLVYLAAYYFSIQIDFETFVYTRFGLAFFAMFSHFWVARKILDISVTSTIGLVGMATMVGLISVASNLILEIFFHNQWEQGVYLTLFVVPITLLVLYWLERHKSWLEIKKLF